GNGPSLDMTHSPTITSPAMMTGVGMILGTAAYMSPEQAKGRPADKRSDIWAFGCVLYEMLTGTRPFGGEDVSDTLAAVLRGEPDLRALPASTPASVRRVLRRCLQKDRNRRLADIADARLDLGSPLEQSEPVAAQRVGLPRAAALAWTVALLAFLIAATFAGLYIRRPVVDAPSVRFTLSPPDGTVVSLETAFGGAARIPIAISPDGRQLALVATDASGHVRLWVRRLHAPAARELPGTANAASPVSVPDSRPLAHL